MPPRLWRDLVVVLSLANLVAVRVWRELLDPSRSYFLDRPRPWQDHAAAIVVVLALAAIGIPFVRILRRSTQVRVRRALELASLGGLVLSPLVIVTFGLSSMAAWRAAGSPPAFPARPPAARRSTWDAEHPLAAPKRPRVVMVVLDGPAGKQERLRAESLRFPSSVPAGTSADTAIPSLLVGRPVRTTSGAGANDRRLRYADGTNALFSDAPTIFQEAASASHDAGLAGWRHPYCRVLGDDLAECHAHASRDSGEILHREGLALATDPSLDLVFLHLPIESVPVAERTLGELRAALEGGELWGRTTFVVASLSEAELLIRLPDGGPAIEDERAVHAIDLHDLVPELLAGRVRTNEQARAWFNAR